MAPGLHRNEQQSTALAQGWPSVAQAAMGAHSPALHTREQQVAPDAQAMPLGAQAAGVGRRLPTSS